MNAPIFIVGTPRSGTTLLAAMLSSHSKLQCGPETHFFSKLSARQFDYILNDSNWPKLAVSALASLTINGQAVHCAYGVSLEMLEDDLRSKPRSVASILEVLLERYASDKGKARWMEKTPNHLLHIRSIEKHFPSALVLQIVRDPRDCALSMRKLPWASQSVLSNLCLCVQWHEVAQPFLESGNHVLTIRYEDLVQNPRGELEKICEMICEQFEPAMLQPGQSASMLIADGETWKNDICRAVQNTRTFRWKTELTPEVMTAAAMLALPVLQRYNYEGWSEGERILKVCPCTMGFVERNEETIVQCALSGIRLLPAADYVNALNKQNRANVDVLLSRLPALGDTAIERSVNAVRFLWSLIKRRLSGRAAMWIHSQASDDVKMRRKRIAYTAIAMLCAAPSRLGWVFKPE